MATVGERIRARREACGLSLTGLSRQSGVSRGFLHLIEQGKTEPTFSKAVRIADALGVTVNALAYDSEMPDNLDVMELRQRIDAALAALKGAGDGAQTE